jgi:hypothetical protein
MFKKSDKQRLINEYAAETGRNTLDVAQIRDWLKGKPEHEFYDYVFGASDDKKIEEYEKDRIAGLIRGLRISQRELRLQAATSLTAWLNRFRGCVEHVGLDVTPMENLVHELRGLDEDAA